MRTLKLPSGNNIPAFGIGTWRMGENPARFKEEANIIKAAIDMGITLIDTAEMYGEGGAEEMLSEAIKGRRDKLCLVSKVYPHNANYEGVLKACERSLRRMQIEVIDLYLLHWPGSFPLSETFEAFHTLQDGGKIRDFGVSNFDCRELQAIPAEDQHKLGCNQVFYNLAHREVESAVAPWCQQRRIPLMAYSPLDQASAFLASPALAGVAARHSASNAQIALAWLLHQPNTVVIPKSASIERTKENLAALDITLSQSDLQDLNEAFPPPAANAALAMR